MFVYEFMSGVVETITGTDEEDFDPHRHRKVEKPTTYSETMIHLLKGSIGAGVLAMPSAVYRLGIIASIIGLLLIGVFATYCLLLLIAVQYELCKRWRRGYIAYPKSMMLVVRDGPPKLRWSANLLYYFVEVVLVLWQLGICVIYFVFIAENIKQVCDFYSYEVSIRVHLCFVLGPLIIINLVKDLKLMTPLSTISNIVTIFGLILVFFYLIEEDVTLEGEKLYIKHYSELPIFIGTALFALEAVGVVLALEYNMEEPKEFVGLFGLFSLGMVVIIMLYILVGVFGYLKYGEEIKATITLNLPQEQKKAQAAKLIFALAIFLTFPLQNYVAYSMVWRKLQKVIPESGRRLPDFALRIALVIIPWLLAVAVPQLGPFISLFGAFCLSLLAVIFPGFMDLCLWYPDSYGIGRYKYIRDILIMLIGFACLISGCYTINKEVGRRPRTRNTLCRSRQSNSSSPVRRVTHVRSLSPTIVGTLSPPLCNSPVRNNAQLLNRSQNDVSIDPVDVAAKDNAAYFSSRPPSEPVHLVICPHAGHTVCAITAKSSLELSRTSKNTFTTNTPSEQSLKILVEASTTRKAQEVVSRLLRSLLLDLPIPSESDVSFHHVVPTSSSNILTLGSETEHRSISVQAFAASATVSVGDSKELSDDGEKLSRKKRPGCDKWMGSIRALRDSHLRLVMRQLRQFRQIERLSRSLKQNYITYSNIAARVLRMSLKADIKLEAMKRERSDIKYTYWIHGEPLPEGQKLKQGEKDIEKA